MPTKSQVYLSTRGGSSNFSFEQAVLTGLASDGGLFIPHSIPNISPSTLDEWSSFTYQQIAVKLLSLYISEDEIPLRHLETLVEKSYATFRKEEITPLKRLTPGEGGLWVLELWHGPTWAFKDVALQFLGNLFEYFLLKKNEEKQSGETEKITVLGATSGDTGSAAIYGLRGKKDISVFILHPKNRISPIQEAQMTSVLDSNVHNIAVAGTFDDCQDIVKTLFSDSAFNLKYHLGAINSINWARILVQITYYFHAYFQLQRQLHTSEPIKIRFTVPTGNFGDILAGYFAKKMGLPIEQLIVATNANDILHRFFETGRYEKHPVTGPAAEGGLVEDGVKAHEEGAKETLSPAMDILVSSNFERLLWYLARDCEVPPSLDEEESNKATGKILSGWMGDLKTKGKVIIGKASVEAARRDFGSCSVSDDQTIETIRHTYNVSLQHYILDPHTAVGVYAALELPKPKSGVHDICLSTAHPAKFSHAVNLALSGLEGYNFERDVLPDEFKELAGKERRLLEVKTNNADVVKELIEKVLRE